MNGIEKITELIRTDAQTEIDRVLEDARRAAEAEKDRAEACAETERAELTAKYEKAAAEREERLISAAQMEARKILLAAKQEMLSKAYDLALEQLVELPEKEYVDLLADLAVKASSTGREAVIFSQKDRARYGKAVVTQANERLKDGHLTMSEQSRPIKGGLILSDGDVEVNCTFETLVRLQRGEMDREVAKVLFD